MDTLLRPGLSQKTLEQTPPRHILTVDEFELDWIQRLFERADELYRYTFDERRHSHIGNLLSGHILYLLFEEPSTRTLDSFRYAGIHLGMQVLSTQGVTQSSRAKGEDLEDMIAAEVGYLPSAIIYRAKEEGDARRAANASDKYRGCPIINAGDGRGEHPTQALLDLYTIRRKLGRPIGNMDVALIGDLANGRTVHSLVKLLSRYPGVTFYFVAPETFGMPDHLLELLDERGVRYVQTTDMKMALQEVDVAYMTRVQTERLTDLQTAYLATDPKAPERYWIGLDEIRLMPPGSILMHPLPRINEIDREVDSDPRAVYIEQMQLGMIARMALIESVVLGNR